MITRIELKNWRSHLDSKLEFSSGTNILLGSIGSGKTSILDAICFALFGTFPTLQTKKLKLDDVIMNKPIEKTKAEIELHFQINGKNYSVKRVIERGKGTTYSEIREEGNLLESPNAQRVTEKIEEILKVDYELFSKAIYSEQNALDYFLTIPRGQRMKKIDELLGIDKFERARASSVTLINRLADRKLGIESSVSQINEEEVRKNLAELVEVISKLSSEKEELKSKLEKIEREKEKLEKELLELKKTKDAIEILRREEKGKESVLEETLSAIKSIENATRGFSKESVERAIKEIEELLREKELELKQKKENYEKIFSEISQAESKIKFLSGEKIYKLKPLLEEKTGIKKELDHLLSTTGENIEEQIEKSRENLEKINSDISATNTLIKDLNSFIQHLSSSENRCPVCDSILTQERKILLIKQKEEQLKKLQDRLADLLINKQNASENLKKLEDAAKKIGEMYIQVKDLQDIQKELEDSEKDLSQLNYFANKARIDLELVRKEVNNIESEIKENEEKKRKYDILLIQLQDLEERKKRSEELKREIEEVKKKIKEKEVKLEGKDLDAMEENLKSIISMESETRTKLCSYDSLIQEKEARRKEQEEKVKTLEKMKKEIQKLDRLTRDLEIFNLALEETQIELRNNFVEGVNLTMSKLWNTLYPYHDFISIRLNAEEGDYVLQLQGRDGNWVNVEGNVSGGERSIACLALRIALALALAPQLRVLVLDEPTANLDARAIRELSITLRERINEFIDQTFLITHQPELEDAATGSVYRLERNKDEDGPTKVIRID
ncbi:MAG: AAA family ATPase [Candidatus Aenigmatarchaeota archaeon]